MNSWMVCPQPREKAHLRLFCFPYAGGSVSTYYTWADHLPEDVEVCSIQLPGRGDRFNEAPFHRLSLLLPPLVEGILPALNLPFALFGHSMGALMSFELARYLRKLYGLQPQLLILSGHPAPQLPPPTRPCSDLSKEQFLEALRNYNGTPSAFFESDELMDLILPVLRADFSLCETYQYTDEAPLDCPIIAYGGTDDPDASLADLLAWRKQTKKEVKVRMFPGDHFYIDTARDLLLQSLAEELKKSGYPN